MDTQMFEGSEQVDLRAVLQASKELEDAKKILAETKKREKVKVASAKEEKDECQKRLSECLKSLEDDIGEEQMKYLRNVFGGGGSNRRTRPYYNTVDLYTNTSNYLQNDPIIYRNNRGQNNRGE